MNVLRLLAASLLVIGLASLAAAEEKKPSQLITSAGNYQFFDASSKLTLKVQEKEGDVTIVMNSALRPRSEDTLSLSAKEGPFWLIYVEAANKVWLFRGVTLTELRLEETAVKSTPVRGLDVLERAPKALLEAIPKDVREKLNVK